MAVVWKHYNVECDVLQIQPHREETVAPYFRAGNTVLYGDLNRASAIQRVVSPNIFCFYLGFESRIHSFSQASDFTLRHPSRWCHESSDSMSTAMSKSSIKTKTVLTMTDMTQSTELQTFIRQKDGYKVTVKISLCICVVLSWDELEVRQNLLDSVYEIYGAPTCRHR